VGPIDHATLQAEGVARDALCDDVAYNFFLIWKLFGVTDFCYVEILARFKIS
jgi:hypothetical protein